MKLFGKALFVLAIILGSASQNEKQVAVSFCCFLMAMYILIKKK
jgi:hypothetical protein